jgi:cysteine synthase A
MPIFTDITKTVGNTPLVRINRLAEGIDANIAMKLEYRNPLGSVKDRIGLSMINEAEKAKLIEPEKTTLIEPTSGNTGIALAFICAARGYKLILTMPETMSLERRKLLLAMGAELILTPGGERMEGAVRRAESLVSEKKNAFMLQQFNNPANVKVHRETTAEEIWRDSEGKVDIFVAAVGTGGTISGVGQVLKARKPSVQVIAVEPTASQVITQKLSGQELKPGSHKIQGIGAGFIPKILDLSVLDEVICVSDDQAMQTARDLALNEGIFAGISSGANLFAALTVARRPENKGKLIVTVACSTGERYLSTSLYEDTKLSVGVH